jgi:serine/threonine protein kinase
MRGLRGLSQRIQRIDYPCMLLVVPDSFSSYGFGSAEFDMSDSSITTSAFPHRTREINPGMASDQYPEICKEIYVRIMDKLEKSHEEGGRFAPNGTAKKVLQSDILRRFFRSLNLDEVLMNGYYDLNFDLSEDILVTKIHERKLYNFLAILIFTSCNIEAARTFTIKLLAQTAWSPSACSLPAEREQLTDLFGEQVTPDRFLSQQACFCPVVIHKKQEVRIQSLDRESLPYLEQQFRGKGSFGSVYQVKIAKGHFYDPEIPGVNKKPKEMARKDYQSSKDMEHHTLKQILASDRTCPNIVDIYGSLAIGSSSYSIFMPLAMCDLHTYMKEDFRTRPNSTFEKTAMIQSARGLARGLEFLHDGMRTAEGEKMVCYHMDLKPNNILVFLEEVRGKPEFVWKISDFGMSRLKFKSREQPRGREKDFDSWFVRFHNTGDTSASATYNRRGEGTYLGPESLSPYRDMRTANDVWSLGCVLSVVFAYLEEGSSGVARYRDRRMEHHNADGYDRFFIPNAIFSRPKVHPVVTLWHDRLIKKAKLRSLAEGEAVKSILNYLERAVLLTDQSKRCTAQDVADQLRDTFQAYEKSERSVSAHTAGEESGLDRALRRMHINVAIGDKQAPPAGRRAEMWLLHAPEAFKGCEISADESVVAFWTDTKISLYTSQSLGPADSGLVRPAAECSIQIPECRWKSISLTRNYLVASTSGGTFQVRVMVRLHSLNSF